jgi:hypothetical protein
MHYLAKNPYANEEGKRQISVTNMTAYEQRRADLTPGGEWQKYRDARYTEDEPGMVPLLNGIPNYCSTDYISLFSVRQNVNNLNIFRAKYATSSIIRGSNPAKEKFFSSLKV